MILQRIKYMVHFNLIFCIPKQRIFLEKLGEHKYLWETPFFITLMFFLPKKFSALCFSDCVHLHRHAVFCFCVCWDRSLICSKNANIFIWTLNFFFFCDLFEVRSFNFFWSPFCQRVLWGDSGSFSGVKQVIGKGKGLLTCSVFARGDLTMIPQSLLIRHEHNYLLSHISYICFPTIWNSVEFLPLFLRIWVAEFVGFTGCL